MVLAQVPQKFNYQAVARDAAGSPLVNASIAIKLDIRNLSAPGVILYTERHDVITNSLGLFSIQVGTGTVIGGTFNTIDWGNGDKYLETSLDPDGATAGYSFVYMGTTQLLSVPYALMAKDSKNGWSLKGNAATDSLTDFLGTTDFRPLKFRVNNLPAGEINSPRNNLFLGVQSGFTNSGYNNIALGNKALFSNTGGHENVAIGLNALYSNTSGVENIAIGNGTLYTANEFGGNVAIGYSSLHLNTGYGNVALGSASMYHNTEGVYNIAMGFQSLFNNTTGNGNVAIGFQSQHGSPGGASNISMGSNSLFNNNSGAMNIAIGAGSLYTNTTSDANIGIGVQALYNTNAGYFNVASGYRAMYNNTDGASNNAYGYEALFNNTLGYHNNAMGYFAMHANQTGTQNIAIGSFAMNTNVGGSQNIALGFNAMWANSSGSDNTVVGVYALNTNSISSRNTAVGRNSGGTYDNGNYCTFLGAYAGANAPAFMNSSVIGDGAEFTASNMIRIGDGGVSVIGGAVGWSNLSDKRLKKNIKDADLGLSFILNLRPVTYEMDYKTDKAGANGHLGKVYTGFIAQEVEETLNQLGVEFSGLCKPQNEKDFYSLRYAEFVVPLVNAVKEQQKTINSQQQEIDKLRQGLALQQQLLEKLSEKILGAEMK